MNKKGKLVRRTEPGLVRYLAEKASEAGLENVRLRKLNDAQNCRKRIIPLLDEMIDNLAEARAAELFRKYRTQERE
jgi:hypothetical protein